MEEADEVANNEGNTRGEGNAELSPVDEKRDDGEGKDGEDVREDDDVKGKTESRWFED